MRIRATGAVAVVGVMATLMLNGCGDASGGQPQATSPSITASITPTEKITPVQSSCTVPPSPPAGMLALQICMTGEDVGLANPDGTLGGHDLISVNTGNNIDRSCGPATCRDLASGQADNTGAITLNAHGYVGVVTVWDGSSDCYQAFNLAAKRAFIFTCPVR